MNDRIGERATCPFFLSVIRSKRLTGVECECLDEHLGFYTSHFLRLKNYQDLTDYTEIFCCDMYDTCPYYRAVMALKYKDS